MLAVETFIAHQITSKRAITVKDGLSNILYWGYARTGYRNTRLKTFRAQVKTSQLNDFINLVGNNNSPNVVDIKNLKLPQYSGLSFVSKIRMFLDPINSAVLDKQIMKIKFSCICTILSKLSHTEKESQIRISGPNSVTYESWCNRLKDISNLYYKGAYRAADIERGFFNLVQCNRVVDAAKILKCA
ncbi:hypothetical protein M1O50_05215 [Dehalococcoidia bacterium]|nr:hypothetical protein [Dehalococcoidia bacterium]